jgi:hypothetical protein
MQDRYVADVGDFGKYGLLRLLAAETNLRLAVVWYLFGNESHNSDGRHLSYLYKPDFAAPDKDLHGELHKLILRGQRSVRAIEKRQILPPNTIFFRRRISDPVGRTMDKRTRAASRIAWLREAVKFSADAELVFLDPDNGIETASVRRHSPKSGKYVYWEELLPFWRSGQSLLIYHHLNRTASVVRQSELLKAKFQERFSDAGLLRYFLFRKGSCRHFWLVSQERHAADFGRAIDAFLQSEWREYFEVG